jgi:hypothetical protein
MPRQRGDLERFASAACWRGSRPRQSQLPLNTRARDPHCGAPMQRRGPSSSCVAFAVTDDSWCCRAGARGLEALRPLSPLRNRAPGSADYEYLGSAPAPGDQEEPGQSGRVTQLQHAVPSAGSLADVVDIPDIATLHLQPVCPSPDRQTDRQLDLVCAPGTWISSSLQTGSRNSCMPPVLRSLWHGRVPRTSSGNHQRLAGRVFKACQGLLWAPRPREALPTATASQGAAQEYGGSTGCRGMGGWK